jgi:hypothetical protein
MLSTVVEFLFGHSLTETEVIDEVNQLIQADTEISELFQATRIQPQVRELPETMRSCYRVDKRQIWISPTIRDRASLREAVLHEFIHANDHLVNGIDLSTVKGLAISEVHAMQTCECRDSWFPRSCTHDSAVEAVGLSIGDLERSKRIVAEVFDEAYRWEVPDNNFWLMHPEWIGPYE